MDDRPPSVADDGTTFATVYPGLRRFASVVGWPEHDPDDLVQEAVARALRHGPLGALDNPGAYLRTSVVRLVANRSRGRRRRGVVHRSLEAGLAAGGTDSYPSDLDELRRLDAADRGLIYLAVIERRPYAEIAALLGIAEPAARKRASRALARLRHELDASEAER
jgi:DNA-directed RNA polymerase specialized sigma24 family protein